MPIYRTEAQWIERDPRRAFRCTACGGEGKLIAWTGLDPETLHQAIGGYTGGEGDEGYDRDTDPDQIAKDEGAGWGMGVPDGQIFVEDDYDPYA